jgi:hypothetical protein
MTDINEALLDPALEQFIRQQIAKQYNRSSVTTDLFRKEPGMGKNVAWDISVGTGTGQVFDDGADVGTFNTDTQVLATLAWGEYGDAFKLTGRAEDVAQFSKTELGLAFFFKMNEARERAAKKVNDDIWTGDGSGSPQKIFGITAANGPMDTAGSYGGQSRITYPQWQGTKLGNGGIPRPITLDTIEYGLEQSFTASGKNPTYGVTTPNVWRLLCTLVDDDRRINQDTQIRGEAIGVKLGYNAVEVNGIPVFRDISVPKGNLVFFHEPSWCVEFLPVAPSRIARGKIMATTPLAGLPQEQLMVGAPVGGPLVANIIALSSLGNYERWQLVSTLQLRNTRPNASLWITDILARTES